MPPRTLVNYVDEAIADVGMRVDRVTEAVQMQFTVNDEIPVSAVYEWVG